MDKLLIVGLGGSYAEHSTSLAALKIALQGASEKDVEVELFGIKEMDLPFYKPDQENVPEQVRKFVEASHRANGMIWSSPLYHGTVSGAFKNALDWLNLLANREPPFLTDKVIGMISTAGGTHGLQAINTMEFVVRSLRGWAVPLVMPVAQAWKTFDETGQTNDPRVETQLKVLGKEVARAARQFAMEGTCDYALPYPGVQAAQSMPK